MSSKVALIARASLGTASQVQIQAFSGARQFNFLTAKKKVGNEEPEKVEKKKRGNDRMYKVNISQSSLMPGEMLVGQPDPISNLRPFKIFIPLDETRAERCYRLLREEAQEYNQEFWALNNTKFQKGLSEIEAKATAEGRKATEAEISEYYKAYLDSSYQNHAKYNMGWWKRNVLMLVPGLIAQFDSLRLFKRRKDLYMSKFANSEIFSPADYQNSSTSKVPKGKNDSFTADKPSNLNNQENSYQSRRKEKVDSYY